ncbi:putative transcriptional regulator [Streptomyces sp. Tu6071]|nr:putative transcriptional regulator [Streptomyces sp. Tu6071]
MPVERRTGHLRLSNDPIDPYGVNALRVEDLRRRAEQPRSRIRRTTRGAAASRTACDPTHAGDRTKRVRENVRS